MTAAEPLTAIALVCSLKSTPSRSSSELIASQILDELAGHGVTGSSIRVADHDVRPGVEKDMGDGDAWPSIRDRIMAADIVIVSTPTWMGQHSSVCQRVLERLDAELSETDEQGRLQTYETASATKGAAANAAHLARLLRSEQYPPTSS